MNEWFRHAQPEVCDAMSALQLDYRFEGDPLGTVWWLYLQQLQFTHNGRTYELPKSAPEALRQHVYEGNEIYHCLDRLAIPQLKTSFDEIIIPISTMRPTTMTEEEVEWWRDTRDELIFRKFHEAIEKTTTTTTTTTKTKQRKSSQKTTASQKRGRPKKQKLATADAGADLLISRNSKTLKSKKLTKAEAETAAAAQNHLQQQPIVFPTIEEYAATARSSYNNNQVVEEREASYHRENSSFEDWRFLLGSHHSLLVYGVGSKRALLNRFASEELEKDGDVLAIDGFDKEVTMDGILQLIVDHWLDGMEPSRSVHHRYDVQIGGTSHGPFGMQQYPRHDGLHPALVVQRAIAIAKALAQEVVASSSSSTTTGTCCRPLYLVVHNIDGVALRNPTAQEALAGLAFHSTTTGARGGRGQSCIRLVASVDHVNGPALLWDSLTCSRFRWVWKHVDTGRPYIEEVTESGMSSMNHPFPKNMSQRRKLMIADDEDDDDDNNATETSIFAVLTSLAPRHAESLQQLASLQLSSSSADDGNEIGEEIWVDYTALRSQCGLKCIVSTDNQLRYFLKELSDHGIVESHTQKPAYRIPYSKDKLKKILNFQR
jgi:origin recognition complex subunit 2